MPNTSPMTFRTAMQATVLWLIIMVGMWFVASFLQIGNPYKDRPLIFQDSVRSSGPNATVQQKNDSFKSKVRAIFARDIPGMREDALIAKLKALGFQDADAAAYGGVLNESGKASYTVKDWLCTYSWSVQWHEKNDIVQDIDGQYTGLCG